MDKIINKYETYSTAVDRLKEAIDMCNKENNSILLDGTIQRFEFCVDLAWKLMKKYLEYEKVSQINSPRMVIKESFLLGLISNGEEWLDMLEDRNLTSHTYDEKIAKNIYNNIISKYYNILTEFKDKIGSVINEK